MSVLWRNCEASEPERRAFSSLAVTWNYGGENINDNLMSRLNRCMEDGKYYYLKAYKKRGKSLRRYLGRSRVRAEWENVKLLAEIGIPTLRLVAYGEENGFFGRHTGVMVTEEIPNVNDLAKLVETNEFVNRGKPWIDEVMMKLSMLVQLMHQHKFIHNDLKWRNVLVSSTDNVEVYIIDCPTGRQLANRMLAPFFERGVIKDLACLDKIGRKVLSRASRLRFYMRYTGQENLDSKDKIRIRKILAFFEGRE